jgi:16S rRNA (guanine527-N7)-methyltransferase
LFPAPAQPDRGPGPLSRGLDLGSGAGFPGLPLKIYAPGTRLTLVESIHKKCAFLREVIRSLALHDVDVFSGRAERLAPEPPPQALAGFPPSLVTLRAVEHFEQVVRTASALVDPGGTLALLIGADQARLVPAVVPAFAWSDAESIPLSERRVILLGKKQGSNESKL